MVYSLKKDIRGMYVYTFIHLYTFLTLPSPKSYPCFPSQIYYVSPWPVLKKTFVGNHFREKYKRFGLIK